MTPEVTAQAEQIVNSFIAAIKSLQEGMALGLTVLSGFKEQIDAVKKAQAQIPAGKGRSHGHEAN